MEMRSSAVTQLRRRRPGTVLAVGLATVLVCSACSGSSDDADESVPVSAAATDAGGTGPDFIPTPDDGAGNGGEVDLVSSTTEFDLSAQPSTPVIEPIPETGVPGIDSNDAFCRAWSEFAGSFQALGLVSAIGDRTSAFRLEVIAASTVTEAVTTMETNLPPELEDERAALIEDLAGPFHSRAVLAEVDLLGAGIEPHDLRDVWLAAVTEAGVDDPDLDVVVPASIDSEALAAAVTAFASVQQAIVEDPDLVTDASIPLTEAYLADSCPDGGILSGNDVIDS